MGLNCVEIILIYQVDPKFHPKCPHKRGAERFEIHTEEERECHIKTEAEPGQCSSADEYIHPGTKRSQFDSWSRHMLELQSQAPVGSLQEAVNR